jgi:hypothetical protein
LGLTAQNRKKIYEACDQTLRPEQLWHTNLTEIRGRLAGDARINNVRTLERGLKYQDLGMKEKKLPFTALSAKPGSSSSLKLRLKSSASEFTKRNNILDRIEMNE